MAPIEPKLGAILRTANGGFGEEFLVKLCVSFIVGFSPARLIAEGLWNER